VLDDSGIFRACYGASVGDLPAVFGDEMRCGIVCERPGMRRATTASSSAQPGFASKNGIRTSADRRERVNMGSRKAKDGPRQILVIS
jgi:hypothetical protein